MKDTVKKLINFRFDRYHELELRLERLAAGGLFLERMGTFAWTFRKGEPKKVRYAVTYFSEGSVFNPGATENQQTYFAYAKEMGWEFVTEFGQMQIFVNNAEHPIPFETDEAEKLANIRRCMRKNFLPSTVTMIVVFLFNLVVQCSSFLHSPTDFLAEGYHIYSLAVMLAVVGYFSYTLLSYFVWCRQSRKSIALGGGCIEKSHSLYRVAEVVFLVVIFGLTAFYLLEMSKHSNLPLMLLAFAQVPILIVFFRGCIALLRKKKQSAKVNRVVSTLLLFLLSFGYMALVVSLIFRFDLRPADPRPYQSISWPPDAPNAYEYRLYSDSLPLTCEQLYGVTDYPYYSYEKLVDSSVFLTRTTYLQDALPAKDSPPRLEYAILEPKFAFVYTLVADELTAPPDRPDITLQPVDASPWGATEAYQRYYDQNAAGSYLLLYPDRLVTIAVQEPLAAAQIVMIREKLGLG